MLTEASRIQCVEDRAGVSLASPLLALRPAGMFPQTGSDLSAPRRRGFCQHPGSIRPRTVASESSTTFTYSRFCFAERGSSAGSSTQEKRLNCISYSFSLLCNIPLYEHNTLYLSIPLLMNIWVVSIFWLW